MRSEKSYVKYSGKLKISRSDDYRVLFCPLRCFVGSFSPPLSHGLLHSQIEKWT